MKPKLLTELINVNQDIYNIVSYNKLPDNPVVERTFRRNGRNIPIFKTYRIMGTVVGKNNTKSTVNLLTTDSGVVTVKMNREHLQSLTAELALQMKKELTELEKKVGSKKELSLFSMALEEVECL